MVVVRRGGGEVEKVAGDEWRVRVTGDGWRGRSMVWGVTVVMGGFRSARGPFEVLDVRMISSRLAAAGRGWTVGGKGVVVGHAL